MKLYFDDVNDALSVRIEEDPEGQAVVKEPKEPATIGVVVPINRGSVHVHEPVLNETVSVQVEDDGA